MHKHISIYTFGDIVYLKTDPEQLKRMVTELRFSIGQVLYTISHNGYTNEVYEYELTSEPNQSLKLGIEVIE